jgi:GntR family transcriptional regulator, rspAB operon transcriptional repressor
MSDLPGAFEYALDGPKWTISDRAYQGLRSAIMSLKMRPGEEINIREISENLGVSRSPVREALLKLEREGLAELVPQKGTFVSRIDLDRMREERFLRESLEEKTIEIFIDKFTEADALRIRDILARQKRSVDSLSRETFLDQDDEFHRAFFEVAGKRMCWDIIQSMSGHYRRMRLLVLRSADIPAGNYLQHSELFEFVRARDKVRAVETLRNHLSKLDTEEKDLLLEFPDYFATQRWRQYEA